MTTVKWFEAEEALKVRTGHLSGHFRLGPKFSKCGKTLGGEVTAAVMAGGLSPCRSCQAEADKELQRAQEAREASDRLAKSAPEPRMPINPKPFDLADPKERERLLFEVTGYLRVSRNDGTDIDGRRYALEALEEIGKLVRAGAYPFPPAPKIVVAIRSDQVWIEEKPRGIRVEVRDFRVSEGMDCDHPRSSCRLPRPHSHQWHYEETPIPAPEKKA